MNRLNELIAKQCPEGVEYKPLLAVANVLYGFPCNSSLFNEEYVGTPIARIRDVLSGMSETYTTEDVPSKYIISNGDLLVGMDGNFHVANWKQDGAILCQRVCKISTKDESILSSGFLSHLLKPIIKKIEDNKQSGTVKHLLDKDLKAVRIPVPPIEVQLEIACILDKFKFLVEELSAELKARRSQYEYYLNTFFDEQSDCAVPLNQVGTLTRGKRFVHADAVEEGLPCIHYGELYTHYGAHANTVKSHIREELKEKMRYAHKGDVIIVGAGENNVDIGVGVSWEGDYDVAVHDACYTLVHDQNSRYISYFLRSHMYHDQIKKYVSSGKICAISAEGIGKALIPLPQLGKQAEIVSVLDRFEELCNNTSMGIPAEIEARIKQYEYFRARLLTFKELKS